MAAKQGPIIALFMSNRTRHILFLSLFALHGSGLLLCSFVSQAVHGHRHEMYGFFAMRGHGLLLLQVNVMTVGVQVAHASVWGQGSAEAGTRLREAGAAGLVGSWTKLLVCVGEAAEACWGREKDGSRKSRRSCLCGVVVQILLWSCAKHCTRLQGSISAKLMFCMC
jgi:hypothetical protein